MLLRANQHKKMIWKNGGGITHEIDREPNNNQDEFDWRLSMACVSYPGGPFSIYPNIDRTLCIIDGQDLTLKLNNNDQIIHLDKNSAPYSFPGELQITCQIHEDTLTDFNVLTKRDKYRHTVQRVIFNKDQHSLNISNSNQEIIFIVVAQGNLQINEITMTKGDAIKFVDNTQLIQINSSSNDNTIIYLVKIVKLSS
jgi:environmental stress-induced protein Ves